MLDLINVFYDPETKSFFRVYNWCWDETFVCGGFSEWYGDAQRMITRQKLSGERVGAAERVVAIDKFDKAIYASSIGWKVKEQ